MPRAAQLIPNPNLHRSTGISDASTQTPSSTRRRCRSGCARVHCLRRTRAGRSKRRPTMYLLRTCRMHRARRAAAKGSCRSSTAALCAPSASGSAARRRTATTAATRRWRPWSTTTALLRRLARGQRRAAAQQAAEGAEMARRPGEGPRERVSYKRRTAVGQQSLALVRRSSRCRRTLCRER